MYEKIQDTVLDTDDTVSLHFSGRMRGLRSGADVSTHLLVGWSVSLWSLQVLPVCSSLLPHSEPQTCSSIGVSISPLSYQPGQSALPETKI